ncbi:MAG TPA: adenosylcobinamide-phosphate synthase CbiB, partial [Acidimicrobiia bacterium]|nr:adenosylcobinamide-phosphate synthase CbiB [Acidimicrobiia bacterium]
DAIYSDSRYAGAAHAAVGVAVGAGAGATLGSTAASVYLAVAGRALRAAGHAVGAALDGGDLPEARRLLPALVGRDPRALDEAGVARAVVESLAENTVDAVVAPCLWALAAGAPGALGYRAVNTLDAMVGHRNDRFRNYGWASARLDDLANWVPARLTAALVVLVRPGRAREIWRAVRDDAPAHPSPNSGVAEAAWAAALGLQLGGTNRYGTRTEVRPMLGAGARPAAADIQRAAALSRDVTVALGLLAGAAGVVGAVGRWW